MTKKLKKVDLYGGPHDGTSVLVKPGDEWTHIKNGLVTHWYFLQGNGNYEYDGFSRDISADRLTLKKNDDNTYSLGK